MECLKMRLVLLKREPRGLVVDRSRRNAQSRCTASAKVKVAKIEDSPFQGRVESFLSVHITDIEN
jgi:hypothetical protein